MTNQKLRGHRVIADVANSDLLVGIKKRENRVRQPPTYDADILFTFTSLTKWALATLTEATKRLKKSAYYRYVELSDRRRWL